MVKIQRLTAETLIEAPRRGPAVPNFNGKLALYNVSTYKLGDKTTKDVRVLNLRTGISTRLLTDDKVHDVNWIPGTSDIVFLKSDDKGNTEVRIADGNDVAKESYIAATYNAPVANSKLKLLQDGSVVFMVTGLVGDDGLVYNEHNHKSSSTGRLFKTANVRWWNELYKPQRYSLWYNILRRDDGCWALPATLHNAVTDPSLEAPVGMYGTDDATSSFDISRRGVAFIAKNIQESIPESAYGHAYFLSIDSFDQPPTQAPHRIYLPSMDRDGGAGHIRVSPDDSNVCFLCAPQENLHDAQLHMAVIGDMVATNVFSMIGHGPPDKEDYETPSTFEFMETPDSNDLSVILTTNKCGRIVLSMLKLAEGEKPKTIFQDGCVSAFYPLIQGKWDRLFVSSSSFIDSSLWQIVDVPETRVAKTISSATRRGQRLGLSETMVSEFWFEGAGERCIHSFMLRPSNFDENKRYPWVLAVHGGPTAAWMDSWSTRWNMAAWAEQGYVVILPNISGSVGFGTKFRDDVKNAWAGGAFDDILNLHTYLQGVPYLDQNKAVLAGASYGAYMISWMFGHEIIKKFCCAVWHDGVFNIPSWAMSKDYISNEGSFGESWKPWETPESYERYNPAVPRRVQHFKNAPPTIVIHSEKDYRVPISEGLAFFRTLQGQRVPSVFLTFPDEDHWVANGDNSLMWHREVWGWMRKCVDGKIKRGSVDF